MLSSLLLLTLVAPEPKVLAPRLEAFAKTCQRERGIASAAFRKHLLEPERARAGWMVVLAGRDADERRAHAASIALAAGAELRVVELDTLVGKYIGETEKNLDAALTKADEDGVVLLFDEADALFRKRGEVKDAHDKYANQAVSYLYTRLIARPDLVVVGVREAPKVGKDEVAGFDAVYTIGGANPAAAVRPWVRLCWPPR